jgi:hypothetical protein
MKEINKDQFITITREVIRLLEGGYFHPNMFLDGRLSNEFYPMYSKSGETMFGLDRYAGHDLYYIEKRIGTDVRDDLEYIYNGSYTFKNQDSADFWGYLDKINARKNWKWNYTGGEKRERLTYLAASIIYPEFKKLSGIYFIPKAYDIVMGSPELVFNFSYAVWNGAGFFKYYASRLNDAIKSGITDPKQLSDLIINIRTNGPVYKLPRSGRIMRDYFKSPEFDKLKAATGEIKPVGALGMVLGLTGLLYVYNRLKGKKTA